MPDRKIVGLFNHSRHEARETESKGQIVGPNALAQHVRIALPYMSGRENVAALAAGHVGIAQLGPSLASGFTTGPRSHTTFLPPARAGGCFAVIPLPTAQTADFRRRASAWYT